MGLTAFLTIIPIADAKYCDPTQTGGTYRDIYCDIKYTDSIDNDLIKVVAEQVGYPEEIVKLILNEGELMSNQKLEEFINNNNADSDKQPIDFAKLPADIKDAWRDSANWADIFNKVYTAYDKEKVLYHTKKSLEYEFKSSEKYWDGQINTTPIIGGDAPFDLIVDLNLIEIVLFGKQAEWMNDVYSFPVKKEDGGKDKGKDEENDQVESGGEGAIIEGQAGGKSTGATNKEKQNKTQKCVPADDPNADLGNHPGSEYANPNCGNGKTDALNGEECDDGNKKSGDGCNQYCMLEKTGAGLMCQDTEAVTFQKPQSGQAEGSPSGQSGSQSGSKSEGCPAGTLPNLEVTMPEPEPIESEYPEPAQSENYPGPNIGGTFKEFPKSTRPPCPVGQSELKIQYGTKEESTCIPTEMCSDLGTLGMEGVEVMFCVNLIKENRPETPYQMNDGCIDCHIAAMADAVDKALQGNVSPLENTTGAFGISSRWGPKFSFNLTTAMKTTLQLIFKAPTDPVKEAQKAAEKYKKDNEAKTTSIPSQEGAAGSLESQAESVKQTTKAVLENLENYREAGGVISDQEFYSRVTPLLNQMEASFNRLRNKYTGLAGSLKLDKKKKCEF